MDSAASTTRDPAGAGIELAKLRQWIREVRQAAACRARGEPSGIMILRVADLLTASMRARGEQISGAIEVERFSRRIGCCAMTARKTLRWLEARRLIHQSRHAAGLHVTVSLTPATPSDADAASTNPGVNVHG